MKIVLIIFLLLNLSILIEPVNLQSKPSLDSLSKINHLLESLEDQLQLNHKRKICKVSKKIDKLIKKNLKELKLVEPTIQWAEINDLIIQIKIQFC